jgi:cytochrome c
MLESSFRRSASLAPFAMLGITVLAAARSSPRTPASGLESEQAGQRIFEQRCALCHTTGDRSAQGPGLGGVVGRKTAAMHFGYSRGLREAKLTWDRSTLDAFLKAPAQFVPGTTMPIAVPDDVERHALLDYLATLTRLEPSSPAGHVGSAQPAPAPPGLRAVAHDGALFVSDDGNGTVWRIAFEGEKP